MVYLMFQLGDFGAAVSFFLMAISLIDGDQPEFIC